jgi:hypothetical protein
VNGSDQPLYTCRVDAAGDGDRTPGKLMGFSPNAICAYPYGGAERYAGSFEVLTFDP